MLSEGYTIAWDLDQNCIGGLRVNYLGINDWGEQIYCNDWMLEYESRDGKCKAKKLAAKHRRNIEEELSDWLSEFTEVYHDDVPDPLFAKTRHLVIRIPDEEIYLYLDKRDLSIHFIEFKNPDGEDHDYILHFENDGLREDLVKMAVDFSFKKAPCND